MRMVEVDEVPVVLSRFESVEVCAIEAACTHRGGPLAEGEREGDVVTCPWQGSRFDLCSGVVVRGRRAYRSSASRSGRATAG